MKFFTQLLLTTTLLQPLAAGAQASSAGSAHPKGTTGPAGANAAVRMCTAADLSLGTDDENSSFNGMSHSGTLLVLRNLSPTACRVAQRPAITFAGADGKALPVQLTIPGAKFMHPGPVLVPVVVAPDAELTSKLRWVSGEVYDDSVCVTPAALVVTIGGGQQKTVLVGHLCGSKVAGIQFEASPLMVDPQYTR